MTTLREAISLRSAEALSEARDPLSGGDPSGEAAQRQAQAAERAAERVSARGVVEAFAARYEGREPDYDSVLAQERGERYGPIPPTGIVDTEEGVSRVSSTIELRRRDYPCEVTVTEVGYEQRGESGMVKVLCHGTVGDARINYDLPIYVVNPPALIEDPDGDLVDDEQNRYREDPVGALEAILVELIQETNPGGDR